VWHRRCGLTRKLRNGVGARNSAGWLSQIGCVLYLCCPWIHMDQLQVIAQDQDIPPPHTRTHANSTDRTHCLTHSRYERHSHSGYHSPQEFRPLLITQQWRRLFQKPHQTAASHACTQHIRTRAEHKCVRYAPRQRCRDAAATARSTSTRSACTEPCTAG